MNVVKTLCRKMSTSNGSPRSLIAVCQLTSDHDLEANFNTCASMIKRAHERNCKMVFFPECFDYIGRNREETINFAFQENGPYLEKFRKLAKECGLWLSLGGFHNKPDNCDKLPLNTHLVIDSDGKTQAIYNKLHLFDLDLPGKVRLMESEFSRAGDRLVPPVETPIGKLGLSICYDVRFPELGLWNRQNGAEILSYPSAFTLNTGLAHWETLLRCRAIETQCYVVAAAQTGRHNEKRISYGHSMVVDPWGAVIAQCSETVDMCFAEINLDYLKEVRLNQPVMTHRRSDLYSIMYNTTSEDPTDKKFAQHTVPASTIFYQTDHTFAFVNLMPVIEGHVLLSPKRVVEHLCELTDVETADLFNTAKRVQKMLQKFYKTQSTTVSVQDGEHAGQTVKHVHAHIIPRKKGDFSPPDKIYNELEIESSTRKPRTLKEMEDEAASYRQFMKETSNWI